jgi:hypothetical protein
MEEGGYGWRGVVAGGGGVEMGTRGGERVHGLQRLMALELSGTRDSIHRGPQD